MLYLIKTECCITPQSKEASLLCDYNHYSSTVTKLGSLLTMHYCILHLLNVSRLSRNRIYNQNMVYFLKYRPIVRESIQIEFGNLVETSVWVPCAHSLLICLQNVCMQHWKEKYSRISTKFATNISTNRPICTRSLFEIFKSPILIMA